MKFAALLFFAAFFLPAQTFDVASVKPAAPGTRQGLTLEPGGHLTATAFSLQTLVAMAYRLQKYELSGGDGWMADDRWNIEAKAEDVTAIPAWSVPYPPEVIAVRLRALLAERFALKTHRETRELKAYTLSLAKGGSKLSTPAPEARAGAMAAGPGIVNAESVTMGQVVIYLNKIMDLPVIDKTGITGSVSFKLKFAPESTHPLSEPAPADAPDIFAALQEQLGLKMESARVPVQVLVIDSAAKPDVR